MLKRINWPKWLNNDLLRLLFIGFIFFAPLFPKVPLSWVNYTYIAIRVEDFYVAALYGVFIIQLLRGELRLRNGFLALFIFFWLATAVSFVYGAYFTGTILFKQVAFLNVLRRVEYMLVFFIAASAIKSKEDLIKYLNLSLIVMLLVLLYGLGQKYLHFPAMQTMNPEYSKGRVLYLTPEARVSSTFAGHYDLAAYIVFFIPIILGFYFYSQSLAYVFLFILSTILLFLTASRTSFIAYAISIIAFLLAFKKYKIILLITVFTIVLSFFARTLFSRFLKVVQIKQIYINKVENQIVIPEKATAKELPAGTLYVELDKIKGIVGEEKVAEWTKEEAAKTTEYKKIVMELLFNQAKENASKRHKTITNNEAELIASSQAAKLKPIYAVLADISSSTRLQIEWPRAIDSFKQNPLIGTGPYSMTEATDNDFLRWLGELGLLGTIPFLLILGKLMSSIIAKLKLIEIDKRAIYIGFIFGLLSLLITATYFDIFEASKIAYIFWMTAGFIMGSLYLYEKK